MFAGPTLDFTGTEAFDDVQVHGNRMMIFVQCHRRDKGRLVFRASPTFAAVMFAAPVNVIQLNDAGQWFAIIPLFHRLHDLVLETPGGVVGHTDVALQGQGRQAGFGLRQQMDGQKPHGERQLGLFEQCPADQRGLVMASGALIQVARFNYTVATPRAGRALKARRPSRLKRRIAFLFRTAS